MAVEALYLLSYAAIACLTITCLIPLYLPFSKNTLPLLVLQYFTCLMFCAGDPPPQEMLQPRRHRPSIEDRIYTVASERTVKSLVAQYRRRKQAQSMPSKAPVSRAPGPEGTKGPQSAGSTAEEQEKNGKARDDIERQIEEQQKSSIMKV